VFITMLSACTTSLPPVTPTATPALTATPQTAPTTPTPASDALQIWVPPQFSADEDALGGAVLARQLATFENAHAGLSVRVRVKAEAGSGSLLDSLIAAYNVAPAVLPDVIALNQEDLARAAAAEMLVPLDEWVTSADRQDYYPFAETLSQVEEKFVGAPFAADARLLVYNTEVYTNAPTRWSEVVTGTLLFPGAEPSALTVLADYLALGGTLSDEAGNPALQFNPLMTTLTQFHEAHSRGVAPAISLTYANSGTSWQAFREGRATLAITSAQWYLAEFSQIDSIAGTLPPTSNGQPFTLAQGWSWALVNKGTDPAAAADLLNWLTAPPQMAEWTLAARVLPTRTSALAAWDDTTFAPLAAALLTRAQLQPPARILDVTGPVLRRALEEVISGQLTPNAAAMTALQSLRSP
jgi:ABC-type glycerol-3-phosphate transport system substrate-binding protein